MNDRLMIAAMAMQGMYTNERYNSISFADTANEALKQADALLAAAGEKEATTYNERHLRRLLNLSEAEAERLLAVVAVENEARASAESKLAACERERDQGKEDLFTAECRLTDREKQIAALKRRLEPLTEDEASDFAWQWDMAASSAVRLVGFADRSRSRRQP